MTSKKCVAHRPDVTWTYSFSLQSIFWTCLCPRDGPSRTASGPRRPPVDHMARTWERFAGAPAEQMSTTICTLLLSGAWPTGANFTFVTAEEAGTVTRMTQSSTSLTSKTTMKPPIFYKIKCISWETKLRCTSNKKFHSSSNTSLYFDHIRSWTQGGVQARKFIAAHILRW